MSITWRRRLGTALVAGLFGSWLVLVCTAVMAQPAAAPASAPTLPEAQKLKIIALRQQVEIYQLRQQLAALELQKAIAAAQVPGYRLTDQLTYEPLPTSTPDVPATGEEKTP